MKEAAARVGGALVVFGAGVFLFFALKAPQGFSALQTKHEEIRQLEKENAGLAKEIAEKRERIRKLRDSRSEQELEVRRRLKLQREGETAIILRDQEKK